MKKIVTFLFLIFLAFSSKFKAQEGFRFVNESKHHERVKFQLINNLIVIPLEINGKKLSFILDSGVSKTILFNITETDSIGLKNVEKVQLQGLGGGNSVDALLSKNNTLSIKKIAGFNETIYVLVKNLFDLSSKMGTTIHGIIGYNLLSNFIVKINYNSKVIDFYNPKTFKYRKCRKCEIFPLEFYRNKPYIDAQIQMDTIGNQLTDVKLLIDSGGSDAIWLFEDTDQVIKTPKRFFNDILGEGLSGAIYGNRSRIPKLKLKSFDIKSPTVSFLDSISTRNARSFEERNGSIGAGVLKRFMVWFDYPNKQIMLKKTNSFKKTFNYNMSGLDVVYNGKQLIKEEETKTYSDAYSQNVETNNSVSFITSFSYKFKPSFIIKNVVKGSPAYKAGLLKDDIILNINYKPAHEFTLGKILEKFQADPNKKIRLVIDRKGTEMKFDFRLEKKI
ncbi:MAG: aspartyl protease family protein [Polaribacter sp.]|uniref:aspartyl protease family protein n=1 Tax=Polaribacter sp. TaxID=1920175 RepID=UPI003BB1A994